MKVIYDGRTDTLSILFREGSVVTDSREEKLGVILDYDDQGNPISLEILDASKRVTEARSVEFQTVE